MADNPSYRGTDVQMSGENSVNSPKPRTHSTSNKFNNSYPHITTARYGTVTPFYVANTVEKETHPLYSSHEVRAETMVSPRFGEIKMKKSYFDVPIRSIYPLNYDLMKVPPVEGDDINDLTTPNRAFIPGQFFKTLESILRNFDSSQIVDSPDYYIPIYIQMLFFLEKFFSRASLFDYLGCHLSSVFHVYYAHSNPIGWHSSFDKFFEAVCDRYFNSSEYYTIKIIDKQTNKVYVPYSDEKTGVSATRVPIHYILELLRDNIFNYNISFVAQGDLEFDIQNDAYFPTMFAGCQIQWDESNPLNIERIIAYQLVCAEYFSDDHIDDIYSTDKFRNMLRYYFDLLYVDQGMSPPTFILNGLRYQYDVFSSVYWKDFTSFMSSYGIEMFPESINYIFILLTKRHSLRFEDYFVGGRLHPLAQGDVNTPVINGNVNAYEVARSMVFTRFLNSVNLSGPEFDNYSKDILDNDAPPRQDVPKFLGMTMSNVGSYEVENTSSSDQGKLVTNIRSTDERFAFDVTLDHDSIILGLVTFEARRMYSKTVDRFFYHIDRYDYFNPMLQHMGDQSISLAELRAGSPFDNNFAYGVSDGEYKQRFGVVSGGIVDFLPSWTMVTDTDDSYDSEDNLNSSYIRSKDVEFDRFFGSLTNNSDAGYFHFVLYFNNQTEPIKPMIVAPEILL